MEGSILANRYLLVARVGSGGMGAVYRATDLRTGGTVAVKLIHPALAGDRDYIARLRREAQLAAAIRSPRVVRVTDLDTHRGTPFLVMEFVEGRALAEVLEERGRLPPPEALGVALEVARALESAHAQGIVHRDLKPENVTLADGQVKVLDFGIAREERGGALTATGTYLGTPEYTAPERVEGMGDIRSDIYALGVILFRMLEGRLPFTAPTAMAVLYLHATAPVPRLSADLPAPVHHLVARCLAKDPAARHQTPAELIDGLSAALRAVGAGATPTVIPARGPDRPQTPTGSATDRVTAVRRPPPAPAATTEARGPRGPRVVWLGAVVLVVVLGAGIAVAVARGRGGDEPSAAAGRPAGSEEATAPVAVVPSLTVDGPPVPVAIAAPGQQARLSFIGTAGQQVSVAMTDVSYAGPCCLGAGISGPDGRLLPGAGTGGVGADGDVIHTGPLPADGTYTVTIDPSQVSSARLTVTLSADLKGEIAVSGPPVTIDLARPGQRARLTFAARAGERVTLNVSDVTTSAAECCAMATIRGPDERAVATTGAIGVLGGAIDPVRLDAAGTYALVVDPDDTRTIRMTLTLTRVE